MYASARSQVLANGFQVKLQTTYAQLPSFFTVDLTNTASTAASLKSIPKQHQKAVMLVVQESLKFPHLVEGLRQEFDVNEKGELIPAYM